MTLFIINEQQNVYLFNTKLNFMILRKIIQNVKHIKYIIIVSLVIHNIMNLPFKLYI